MTNFYVNITGDNLWRSIGGVNRWRYHRNFAVPFQEFILLVYFNNSLVISFYLFQCFSGFTVTFSLSLFCYHSTFRYISLPLSLPTSHFHGFKSTFSVSLFRYHSAFRYFFRVNILFISAKLYFLQIK